MTTSPPQSAPLEPSPVPRCITCAYTLSGLKSPGNCPECGRPFNLLVPGTFTFKVPFVRRVFWLPPFVLAGLGGVVMAALLVFGMGNWGVALWVGVPLSIGCIIGYGTRARVFVLVILSLAGLTVFIVALMSMQLAGIFCGLVLAAICMGPVLVGTFAGWLLRLTLKTTRFSQRSHLPSIALLAIGPVWAMLEGPAGPSPPESVSTREVIAAPVQACWDSIMFYEEVRHPAPLILRIGLARPLRTLGGSSLVGDRKTCIYNKGHITKEITEVSPGRVLAFKVVEQEIGYEHDVRIMGGSFRFDAVDPGHTAVTLTTSYEPLITPRFAWRWAEEMAVHTLHGHVLEGMRRRAEGIEPMEHHPHAPGG